MAGKSKHYPERLSAAQAAERARLQALCARLEHTKGLTGTVFHEKLAQLDALVEPVADTTDEQEEVIADDSGSETAILAG